MLKEKPKPHKPVVHKEGNYLSGYREEIPLDMYRYFNINPMYGVSTRAKEELKYIYNWASREAEDIGDVLQNINGIQMRMGQAPAWDKNYTRIYNYLRIKEDSERYRTARQKLENQRRNDMRRWREEEKKRIEKEAKERNSYKPEIDKLDKQINKLEKIQQVYER